MKMYKVWASDTGVHVESMSREPEKGFHYYGHDMFGKGVGICIGKRRGCKNKDWRDQLATYIMENREVFGIDHYVTFEKPGKEIKPDESHEFMRDMFELD